MEGCASLGRCISSHGESQALGCEDCHAESGREAAARRAAGDGVRVSQRDGNPAGKGSYQSGEDAHPGGGREARRTPVGKGQIVCQIRSKYTHYQTADLIEVVDLQNGLIESPPLEVVSKTGGSHHVQNHQVSDFISPNSGRVGVTTDVMQAF